MEIRTTKEFVISKTILDDTLPNSIYFVEINKSLTGFSTVTVSGVHNGNMCVLHRVLFDSAWGEWKLDKPLRLDTGAISSIAAEMLDMFYPVGSIYMAYTNINPSALFGGSWERIKDTFLLAAGDKYSAGAKGGEATHKLTVSEMPSHYHNSQGWARVSGGSNGNQALLADGTDTELHTLSTGGGQAHNNMPPYLAVYVWKRTA